MCLTNKPPLRWLLVESAIVLNNCHTSLLAKNTDVTGVEPHKDKCESRHILYWEDKLLHTIQPADKANPGVWANHRWMADNLVHRPYSLVHNVAKDQMFSSSLREAYTLMIGWKNAMGWQSYRQHPSHSSKPTAKVKRRNHSSPQSDRGLLEECDGLAILSPTPITFFQAHS